MSLRGYRIYDSAIQLVFVSSTLQRIFDIWVLDIPKYFEWTVFAEFFRRCSGMIDKNFRDTKMQQQDSPETWLSESPSCEARWRSCPSPTIAGDPPCWRSAPSSSRQSRSEAPATPGKTFRWSRHPGGVATPEMKSTLGLKPQTWEINFNVTTYLLIAFSQNLILWKNRSGKLFTLKKVQTKLKWPSLWKV